MQTTGNLSEDDIISGAISRYCALAIYEAIRKDREQDKRKGKAAKWKAKLAHCKWVACWRVLRTSDKLSGAANTTDDQSVDPDDSANEDADSGSTSSPSARNKGYQRQPCGIKAAKLMRSEDAGMKREVKESTAAVGKLTAAQLVRTAPCFFDSPAMRNTPEAAKYRQGVMQKMMASAGLAEKPAPPAPPEAARTKHATDILVVEDSQRGRKAQAAKQLAASASLNKPLETTRGLEHSSESKTTTTTTTESW